MIDIRFDCRHFKGTMPCNPHKGFGVECNAQCRFYEGTEGNILIIKLGAMGDVIRTTPLLRRLIKEYPDKRIFWLTHFPEVLPEIVDIKLRFSTENITYIRSVKFDLAINLDKEIEACALMQQLEIEQQFGFGLVRDMPAPLNDLAEHKFITGISDSYSKSNTQHYLSEIFAICGWKYDQEKYMLPQMESNVKIDSLPYNQKLIGLNTGCGSRWTSRQWPVEYWHELAELLEQNGYDVLLLGGEQEHTMNQHLMEQTGAKYLGYFPFNEFQALMNKCSAVVSMVTMAMHVAIGLEKPLVLLNNIFNPHEFHFFNKSVILGPVKECQCYYKPVCINPNSCMNEIKPIMVLDAVREIIPS